MRSRHLLSLVATAAAPFRLTEFDKVTINGVEYRPEHMGEFGHTLRRLDHDDVFESFSHEEIHTLHRQSRLKVDRGWFTRTSARLRTSQKVESLPDLPQEVLRTVLWRQAFCDRFLAMVQERKATRSDASMAAAIAAINRNVAADLLRRQGGSGRCGTVLEIPVPPRPSTLRLWLKAYRDTGFDPLALIPGKGGNIRPRKDAESWEFAARHAEEYASSERRTKSALFAQYNAALAIENERRLTEGRLPYQSVSHRTFDKMVDAIDPFHVAVGREGWEKARRMFGAVNGGKFVTRPLERIEMDEMQFDLHVLLIKAGVWSSLSKEQQKAVGKLRPWLSLAIDCATRCILAMRLTMDAPSPSSAIATLEMVVSDKSHLSAAAGAKTRWDMAGTFDEVVMDSGSAFIADLTKGVIAALKARAVYPPAGLPEMRGTVERIFGTLQRQFTRNFTGQTFENVVAKGDYDSEENASIDIEELNRTLILWVLDCYHNTPHAGLAGETPRNAWLRLTKQYGAAPPPNATQRRNIFGIVCERRIQAGGVCVLGIHYQSRELQQLRRTFRNQAVRVRVDRFDLGAISVQAPDGQWLSVKPAVGGLDLAGVTWREWRAATEELRRRHADMAKASASAVNAAILAIRDSSTAAAERAELGKVILRGEDFDAFDRKLGKPFEFVTGGQGIEESDGEDDDIFGWTDGGAALPAGPPMDRTPLPEPAADVDDDACEDWVTEADE
ncbi:Mu transposase C-terminal domain-containing protein [Nitrospirillum sp. BR 11164]|uniref:Mu transposase C-terminal domain-containing protein n=1 Tax=Nitrospirillum sp. BR 11164 TaxID=3104324 RepID=UPI002AFE4FD4|nr:Mu transposase C-terminal domain-containing protein [Nitrospirillum sp. BR 11164]MEA1647816.1 Mu transposase C-terminal domain-containing protein [Nitrospirillum sp. BR 11164]